MIDVEMDLFSDDGDSNFSSSPEVGSFNSDVVLDVNGKVDDVLSGIFLEVSNEDGEFKVDSINSLLNSDVHFQLEVKDVVMSFTFDSDGFVSDIDFPFTCTDNNLLVIEDGDLFNFSKVVGVDFEDS